MNKEWIIDRLEELKGIPEEEHNFTGDEDEHIYEVINIFLIL